MPITISPKPASEKPPASYPPKKDKPATYGGK